MLHSDHMFRAINNCFCGIWSTCIFFRINTSTAHEVTTAVVFPSVKNALCAKSAADKC